MKKLMMTVVAGSLCAAFGSAYAQGTPGPSGAQATPTSKTGVQTPRQVDDNRMAQGGKGDAKAASTTGSSTTGGSTAGSSTTGAGTAGASSTAGTSGASSSAGTMTDTGGSKGRRAARREKG